MGDSGQFPRASRGPHIGRSHLGGVERKKRVEEIDGIGCEPCLVSATTEEILEWIGEGLRSGILSFPENTGPILWPQVLISQVLSNA